jgi:hypothetical protein
MESPTPSVGISTAANDRKVNEAPRELFDSQLVLISVNKTLSVWKYFAMVKDKPITCNEIQYIYCCLLCLKKCLGKFLDASIAI